MNKRNIEAVDHYDYQRFKEHLQQLKPAFPFLEITKIGESVSNRDIMAVRIGTGPKEIHYNAAFHANEWITTPLLMTFIEEAAYAITEGTWLRGKNVGRIFEECSLWIVPMVNPDGVDLVLNGLGTENPYYDKVLEWNGHSLDFQSWKANIRGVDLNDQFPACWDTERDRRGVAGPGPRDYTGETPLSEPEAKAMADFTQNHDFELVIALHTQGQEIYWNYRDLEPLRAVVIAEIFAEASGYRAVKLTDSDAGYKDWFIQESGRPGFTIEVGLGSNPLPVEDFFQLYEEIADILLEALCI
ncbi:Gamma-D-glutamyl-L-diamino acid endopeptidase 1 [compost metagenome]